VTAISGLILILLGVVPKVGTLCATIPPAAIGGGGLIMFAMIFASGLSIIQRDVPLDRRNLVILAVAVGLGLGVEVRPEILRHLPNAVRTFLGSGLITGGLTALLLNLALPEREP
jgi:NCS2 family nucleobase:cation symporter-2